MIRLPKRRKTATLTLGRATANGGTHPPAEGDATLNALAIVGSLIVVGLWEFLRPWRRREFPTLRRRLGNLGIWLLNIVVAGFVFAPKDTFRPQLEAAFHVTLPTWPMKNIWLDFVVAFLLLDFMVYAVHRCQHAVPFLWRFHALHHSDPDVDVTTSVRHHPIEYLLATAFYWAVVLLFDVPSAVVATHAAVVFAAAAVTHGNTRMPEWVERVLQPVVITLDLHLVHHSTSSDEANANFGAVFSVWDRLFGTYRRLPRAQVDQLAFGVRELPRPDCVRPARMLMTPWLLARSTRLAGVRR